MPVDAHRGLGIAELNLEVEPLAGRDSGGLLERLPVVQLPCVGAAKDRIILEGVPQLAAVRHSIHELKVVRIDSAKGNPGIGGTFCTDVYLEDCVGNRGLWNEGQSAQFECSASAPRDDLGLGSLQVEGLEIDAFPVARGL